MVYFLLTLTAARSAVYCPPLLQGAFKYGASVGQTTEDRTGAASALSHPVATHYGRVARPLGFEPKTLCLEGNQNGAQALYLQAF